MKKLLLLAIPIIAVVFAFDLQKVHTINGTVRDEAGVLSLL